MADVTTALVLRALAPASTALVLGAEEAAGVPPVEISGTVAAPMSASGSLDAYSTAPALQAGFAVGQPAAAQASGHVAAVAQPAKPAASHARATTRASALASSPVSAACRAANAAQAQTATRWRNAAQNRQAAWQHSARPSSPAAAAFSATSSAAAPRTASARPQWKAPRQALAATRAAWSGPAFASRAAELRFAAPRSVQASAPAKSHPPLLLVSDGAWLRVEITPAPCCDISPALVFAALAPAGTELVFACDADRPSQRPALVVVPAQRSYLVTNNTHLRRADTGQPIPASSFSLQLDSASWTWRFQAGGIPATLLPVLERDPEGPPVPLILHVNGTDFALLVRGISREREFGKASVSITAFGQSALLDAPFARARVHSAPFIRTAQQLANEALTENGASLGWSIDWQIDNWVVPASAWSHQGTPISAVRAIATAAGAYVQPHDTANTLRILPMYPAAPWDWSATTPDYELPADVVRRESIEWAEKPSYNRVYIAGTAAGGRIGQVTRAGTAGDVEAPTVVDPLITSAVASRQRGLSVLADTGMQALVSLRLPILGQTGIIRPGALVRYVDGANVRPGIVRATSVQRQMPSLWQTLSLETHA